MPHRVLVIEDEQNWREQFQDILVNMGFEVDTVGTAKDAEALLRTGKYELVLLDAALDQPYFTLACQQFCDSLHERYPNLPVVATTGRKLDPEEMRTLFKLGVVDFIYKPKIHLPEFRRRIQNALKEMTRAVAHVTILLEGDFEEFTTAERDNLVFALSRIVNVTSDQIRVLSEAPGSVLVILEMPQQAAQVLVSMYLTDDPVLRKLHIQKVELRQTLVSPGKAGRPTVFTQAYALLIGIAAYRHIRPLAKTTTDARDLHDTLIQNGYSPSNMSLLLDEQATKAVISDKLEWLARRAGPDDTVVIFFSGHGAQLVGGFWPGEYLCPVEAALDKVKDTLISDEDFTTALRAIHAGRLAVFLDACHAGGVGEPKDPAMQVKAGLSDAAYARFLAQGRVIIASCKPDEVSYELAEMRNGLFTHYLLEGLRGGAARPDGTVWMSNLFGYVYEHVSQHNLQHPFQKSAAEDFVIVLTRQPQAEPAPSVAVPAPTVAPADRFDPASVDPTKLRKAMHSVYDRPAFEILCKDLGLDYHDLRGETLETKILYLIDHFQRHRQYETLVCKVLSDHPHLKAELSL